MHTRAHHLIFALVTLVALVAIATQHKIDCTDPSVWATESGVRACAVNGGK